jgi:hypothetical protein
MKNKINKKDYDVVIEVFGGVASVVQTKKSINVLIVDRDNNVYMPNKGGQNYESTLIKTEQQQVYESGRY